MRIITGETTVFSTDRTNIQSSDSAHTTAKNCEISAQTNAAANIFKIMFTAAKGDLPHNLYYS